MKDPTFRGVGHELPKRGGLGQFADLRRGAWQEKGGGVFLRGG